MRLIALLFAFLLSVSPAAAATLTATPGTLGAVWSQAKAGDTLKLVGTFPWAQLPARTFKPRLTIDASKATLGGFYSMGMRGVTVTGGVWGAGGLRFDNFADVTVTDAEFISGPERNGTALWFANGANAYAARVNVTGFNVGVSMTGVTGFVADRIKTRDVRSDGFTFPDSHKGQLTFPDIRTTRPPAGEEHPDGIQCWSIPGKPPVSDIDILDAVVVGYSSGVGCYNTADGGVLRVKVRRGVFIVGYAHGISLNGARESEVTDNIVGTYPGVRDQALIGSDTPAGLKRCNNIVQAYGAKPAVIDAPC